MSIIVIFITPNTRILLQFQNSSLAPLNSLFYVIQVRYKTISGLRGVKIACWIMEYHVLLIVWTRIYQSCMLIRTPELCDTLAIRIEFLQEVPKHFSSTTACVVKSKISSCCQQCSEFFSAQITLPPQCF